MNFNELMVDIERRQSLDILVVHAQITKLTKGRGLSYSHLLIIIGDQDKFKTRQQTEALFQLRFHHMIIYSFEN